MAPFRTESRVNGQRGIRLRDRATSIAACRPRYGPPSRAARGPLHSGGHVHGPPPSVEGGRNELDRRKVRTTNAAQRHRQDAGQDLLHRSPRVGPRRRLPGHASDRATGGGSARGHGAGDGARAPARAVPAAHGELCASDHLLPVPRDADRPRVRQGPGGCDVAGPVRGVDQHRKRRGRREPGGRRRGRVRRGERLPAPRWRRASRARSPTRSARRPRARRRRRRRCP